MKNIKTLHTLILSALCSLAVMAGCDRFEGDVTVPSYISIQSITLQPLEGTSQPFPNEFGANSDGFHSSLVDAVQVEYYVKGDTAWTNLGVYQLPCKIPVLRTGNIDTLVVTPVVKQNGVSGTRISYPFYQTIGFGNVNLVVDSVLDFGHLKTSYSRSTHIVWEEYFEPYQFSISMDTDIVCLHDCADSICSGYGSGLLMVTPNMTSPSFWSDSVFTVNDPGAYLYLEFDYWTDFDLSVGLLSQRTSGSTVTHGAAEVLYANKGWQKIYVNLGRLWGTSFGHYPHFRVIFTALNDQKKSGKVLIDNVKLITM